MRDYFTALCCLVGLSQPGHASEPLVGKTVMQATQLLGVDLANGTILDDPPAVPRGIAFRTKQGDDVQVFIRRGQVPLTFQGGDNLVLYKDLKVIGFRKVEHGIIYCEGEVLWQFKCGATNSGR